MTEQQTTWTRVRADLYWGMAIVTGQQFTVWHDRESKVWFVYKGYLTERQADVTQHDGWADTLREGKDIAGRMTVPTLHEGEIACLNVTQKDAHVRATFDYAVENDPQGEDGEPATLGEMLAEIAQAKGAKLDVTKPGTREAVKALGLAAVIRNMGGRDHFGNCSVCHTALLVGEEGESGVCLMCQAEAEADEPYCNHDASAVVNGVCECGATVSAKLPGCLCANPANPWPLCPVCDAVTRAQFTVTHPNGVTQVFATAQRDRAMGESAIGAFGWVPEWSAFDTYAPDGSSLGTYATAREAFAHVKANGGRHALAHL
jgi:hypothetical protein